MLVLPSRFLNSIFTRFDVVVLIFEMIPPLSAIGIKRNISISKETVFQDSKKRMMLRLYGFFTDSAMYFVLLFCCHVMYLSSW